MRKSSSLLLAFAIFLSCFSVVGCNNDDGLIKMETANPNAYVISQLGDDTLPVAAYVSPTPGAVGQYPDLITEEYYKLAYDGGINVMMGHNEIGNLALETKSMDLCAQFDMAYLVYTGEMGYYQRKTDNGYLTYADYDEGTQIQTNTAFENKLKAYKQHEAFAGIKFSDEDGYAQFPGAKAAKEVFDRVCEGKLFSYNLLSSMADSKLLENGFGMGPMTAPKASPEILAGGWDYYIESAIKNIGLDMVSYDLYPYSTSTAINGYYFSTLSRMNTFSKANGTPWWTYLQCYGSENNIAEQARSMNYAETAYNVNTSLLFGAKGLVLFSYFCPMEWTSLSDNMVYAFDKNGKTMKLYYYYKEVLNDVRAFDHILMKSEFKGVMVSKENNSAQTPPMNVTIDSFNELQNVKCYDSNALVGCFNYQGKTALYIVNGSIKETEISDITLNFSKNLDLTYIYKGETKKFTGKNFTLYDVKAGDGAMIVLG